jgi:mono/diheme cytochrome c family protein
MRWSLPFLGLAWIVGSACADPWPRLREHTYPPSFEYIDPSRLQSAMWELAFEVQRLDRSLQHPADDPADQQRHVAEILSRMDGAVDRLSTPGRVTQHPLLNRNLPRFREQVRRARADAALDPPNYFAATMLLGSCAACHGGVETTSAGGVALGARPLR